MYPKRRKNQLGGEIEKNYNEFIKKNTENRR